MENTTKTIFFGTPNFSVPFLSSLIDDDRFDVVAVVTEPNRKAGRGKQVKQTAVADFVENLQTDSHCERIKGARQSQTKTDCFVGKPPRNDIQVFKPKNIKNIKPEIKNLRPQITVVVAYGQIIPQNILDIPKYGAINVHPSNLPKYRGPSPIQSALLNGDKKTSITIMKMDEKMDHGAILDKLSLDIDIDDDYYYLEKKMLETGPKFLIDTLKNFIDNNIEPQKQDDNNATYCKMIEKSQGKINWTKSAREIHNLIRAYTAWPKTYTIIDDKRLIFLSSVIDSGKIKPLMVQLEGKKPTSWEEFTNGYKKKLPKELTDRVL